MKLWLARLHGTDFLNHPTSLESTSMLNLNEYLEFLMQCSLNELGRKPLDSVICNDTKIIHFVVAIYILLSF